MEDISVFSFPCPLTASLFYSSSYTSVWASVDEDLSTGPVHLFLPSSPSSPSACSHQLCHMLSICWSLFHTHPHSFPFKIHINSNWFLHEAPPQSSPKLLQWLPSDCSSEHLSHSSYRKNLTMFGLRLFCLLLLKEKWTAYRSLCCATCQVLMEYLVSVKRLELRLRTFSGATWVVWIMCDILIKMLSASWFNSKHYKDTYVNPKGRGVGCSYNLNIPCKRVLNTSQRSGVYGLGSWPPTSWLRWEDLSYSSSARYNSALLLMDILAMQITHVIMGCSVRKLLEKPHQTIWWELLIRVITQFMAVEVSWTCLLAQSVQKY